MGDVEEKGGTKQENMEEKTRGRWMNLDLGIKAVSLFYKSPLQQ